MRWQLMTNIDWQESFGRQKKLKHSFGGV